MNARVTQLAIHEALCGLFGPDLVKSEWSVRTDATDKVFDRSTYAPRLDIAVGPFNVTRERKHDDLASIDDYGRHPFIRWLRTEVERQNHGGFYLNPNPRCLLAIELEYSTSSKHILGGITNASLLGAIGVIVGPAAYIAKIQRIAQYAARLRQIEKAHDDMFANIACFPEDEFLRLLAPRR
ncbi:hypothetical protein XI03_09335 [Bradyrhizobium sp. CCBAU 65884]|uniref:hypothetical protein n=1 Tax=Bradyrhizobium sp. CCBAU 65884 TaxID=722477 RepID=UPI0023060424|nr:hypothetical protein [Bradyrhizobium sp. CCBAU 65884]MDA9474704.1 hypothetical protein [Bradyrhizobium sp. CCBAU 65884]